MDGWECTSGKASAQFACVIRGGRTRYDASRYDWPLEAAAEANSKIPLSQTQFQQTTTNSAAQDKQHGQLGRRICASKFRENPGSAQVHESVWKFFARHENFHMF